MSTLRDDPLFQPNNPPVTSPTPSDIAAAQAKQSAIDAASSATTATEAATQAHQDAQIASAASATAVSAETSTQQAASTATAAASTASAASNSAQTSAEIAQEAAEAIIGDIANAPVLGTGASVASSLGDRVTGKGRVFNAALDFGIDNTGATDVRDAMEAFLALAGKTYQTTLIIPAGDYLIGSDLATNVQDILHYRSNCTLLIYGNLLHNVNSGNQHILAGQNVSNDAGTRNSNVHIHWLGGKVVFMPRTKSQSRKGLNMSFTDTFSVTGYRSEGDDSGSFTGQVRSSTQGMILGSIMNAGNSTGEDGWHLIRDCSDIIINASNIRAGDDAISLTQENGGGAYDMHDITINGCNAHSTQNSSFKVLVDTASAALGSKIRRVSYNGGIWGITGKANGVGSLCRISVEGTNPWLYPEAVADISITGVLGDNSNPAGTGFLASTSVRVDYASRVTFNSCKLLNVLRNGVIFNGGYDNHMNMCEIGRPQAQTSVSDVTGLTGTSFIRSGTSVVIQLAGSPDLSTVAASTSFTGVTVASATMASNNGTFLLAGVDNVNKTLTVTVDPSRQNATDDETGSSATIYVRKQAGECVVFNGAQRSGLHGCRLYGSQPDANGRVISHTQGVILKTDTASGLVPTNNTIDVELFDFPMEVGLNIQQGVNTKGKIAAYNCNGRFLAQEGTNAANGGTRFFDCYDEGSVRYRAGIQVSKANSSASRCRSVSSDKITLDLTIPVGSTSATISVPNNYTPPSGANVANVTQAGFIPGYVSTNLKLSQLTVKPTNAVAAAGFFQSLSGSTFTVSVPTAPTTTPATFACELNGG